jgi:hypothetical protein
MKPLEFLKQCHDLSLEKAKSFRFDKQYKWHRNLIALHGSLIELSGALIVVADKQAFVGIKPIARTTLETYVEFKNLREKREYGNHLEASYYDQWLKIYNSAKGGNPYLAAIAAHETLEGTMTDSKAQLEKLNKKGFKPLNIFQRFERAGMEDEYRSIYNFLSNESHSNIRALIDRHIEIIDNTKEFHIVFYREREIEECNHYLTMAAGFMIESASFLHDLLGTKEGRFFATARKELDSIQQKMST